MSIVTVPEIVKIKPYKDQATARDAARQEADEANGYMFPVMMFKQGSRYHLSTVMPLRHVVNRLVARHAPGRASLEEVRTAQQRPIYPEHVANIKRYIQQNLKDTYILPPMMLNVEDRINIYVPDYAGTNIMGYAVLPETARMAITDGGHRKKALDELAQVLSPDELQELYTHSVSVMITLENNVDQVHQDFADAAKTKELPKSLIAAYDRRNPANGVVLDLIDACPLFRDKIDSVSKTLSRKSIRLFLTNHVRQVVKELLLPNGYAYTDTLFEQQAVAILQARGSEPYADFLAKARAYIDEVTCAVAPFEAVARMTSMLATSEIPQLREQGWISLTATGLVVIGRIGRELVREHWEGDAWKGIVARMSQIDWHRDADIWQGNIVQNGRVLNQQQPVKAATEKVRVAIGLEPRQ